MHISKTEILPIGFREFVSLMAAVMALVALAIDSMLPALPAIGHSLGVANENHRQLVISSFLLGFGVSQLAVGILSDRFGRRGLMLGSLSAFVLFSGIAMLADSFPVLIAARIAQGAAAAGGRVLVTSIVRDLYAGRTMARVMSLAQMMFLAAPVVAPSMGQLILLVASWRWIFFIISVAALIVLAWVIWRLPETLPIHKRQPLGITQLRQNIRTVLVERQSLGYTVASMLIVSGLIGFLNSVQQIFEHVIHHPKWLAPVFALMSLSMAAGSLLNSRFVERIGMRKISHATLLGFIVFSGLHAAFAAVSSESVVRFAILQSGMMICFVLAAGNFSAMAMEHVGAIAGTASSCQSFFISMGSVVIGAIIGQAFNNTVVPLYLGCALCGGLALVVVLVTERGRLFVPHHEQPMPTTPAHS